MKKVLLCVSFLSICSLTAHGLESLVQRPQTITAPQSAVGITQHTPPLKIKKVKVLTGMTSLGGENPYGDVAGRGHQTKFNLHEGDELESWSYDEASVWLHQNLAFFALPADATNASRMVLVQPSGVLIIGRCLPRSIDPSLGITYEASCRVDYKFSTGDVNEAAQHPNDTQDFSFRTASGQYQLRIEYLDGSLKTLNFSM